MDNACLWTLFLLLSLNVPAMSAPGASKLPIPATPVIVSITTDSAMPKHYVLTWRPVAGGWCYEIQRAESQIGRETHGPWEEVANPTLTDKDVPWTDKGMGPFIPHTRSLNPLSVMGEAMEAAEGVWYRIRAFNFDGVPGAWSADYTAQKPDPKWNGVFLFRH